MCVILQFKMQSTLEKTQTCSLSMIVHADMINIYLTQNASKLYISHNSTLSEYFLETLFFMPSSQTQLYTGREKNAIYKMMEEFLQSQLSKPTNKCHGSVIYSVKSWQTLWINSQITPEPAPNNLIKVNRRFAIKLNQGVVF